MVSCPQQISMCDVFCACALSLWGQSGGSSPVPGTGGVATLELPPRYLKPYAKSSSHLPAVRGLARGNRDCNVRLPPLTSLRLVFLKLILRLRSS